jgi:hypothetical protein
VFTYDVPSVTAIVDIISNDRLTSYQAAAEPTDVPSAALELYVWNVALSGAFFGPLQALEVAIRNALHRELTMMYTTAEWYRHKRFKSVAPYMIGSLVEAAGRLVHEKKPVDPPHLVAALHFGFWTQLLKRGPDGNYIRHFWNAGLYRAFRHYPGGARDNRGRINADVLALKDFRNRIAHHEPIHNKKPDHQYERVLRVASWIDPVLPCWIEFHGRCRSLLASKPASNPGF